MAFLLSGEMAVAYFLVHGHLRFWPILNGGEIVVANCFVFLYIASRGAGAFSVDGWIEGREAQRRKIKPRTRLSTISFPRGGHTVNVADLSLCGLFIMTSSRGTPEELPWTCVKLSMSLPSWKS